MKTTLLALAACLAIDAGAAPLVGEVLEFRDVDAYTYLKLRTKDGDVWAAASQAPVKKGATVTIVDAMEMRDFTSKQLGRTFESIWFGVIGEEAQAANPHAGMAHPPVPAAPAAPIPKAEGPDAKTVAEVISGRAALRDKQVTVRARVERVSPGIMGMNWVHLRDGSGSPAEENFDVVFTSTQSPQVGDIVVARGVVHTDVEMGTGHAFRVLVQDATFEVAPPAKAAAR